MIKKIFFACSILLFIASCGPSQEELDRLQREEDSLMEIERNAAIEKANQQLLGDTTLSDTIKTDSAIEKTKK